MELVFESVSEWGGYAGRLVAFIVENFRLDVQAFE
jgi:hypothetical protein